MITMGKRRLIGWLLTAVAAGFGGGNLAPRPVGAPADSIAEGVTNGN